MNFLIHGADVERRRLNGFESLNFLFGGERGDNGDKGDGNGDGERDRDCGEGEIREMYSGEERRDRGGVCDFGVGDFCFLGVGDFFFLGVEDLTKDSKIGK